jgi:hypothetical protein
MPKSFWFFAIYLQCGVGFYSAANAVTPFSGIQADKVVLSIVWPLTLTSIVTQNQMLQYAQRCRDDKMVREQICSR